MASYKDQRRINAVETEGFDNLEIWERTVPDLPKLYEAARAIASQFDALIERANVKDSGEARISACLCLTIGEQFYATLCLLEGHCETHAPGPIRSMLEGLADLINLLNDPAYLGQLKYENAKSDATLFDEYAQVPDIATSDEIVATLNAWKQRAGPLRDELYAKGFRKLPAEKKFEMAGLHDDYVAYRVLCAFVHTSVTSLIARHGDVQPMLRYRDVAAPEQVVSFLNVAVECLGRTLVNLPKFTDLNDAEIQAVVAQARTTWLAAIDTQAS